MIYLIEYNQRQRVILLLGRDEVNFYCLASEKVPESIASSLLSKLRTIENLFDRIKFIKEKYPALYLRSFRSLKSSKVKIISKYE